PTHQAPGTATELARARADQAILLALKQRESAALTQYLLRL
ncbi:MAG: hypothetical protein FD129_2357, partial [bacterium]